jgi:hypothetical protein
VDGVKRQWDVFDWRKVSCECMGLYTSSSLPQVGHWDSCIHSSTSLGWHLRAKIYAWVTEQKWIDWSAAKNPRPKGCWNSEPQKILSMEKVRPRREIQIPKRRKKNAAFAKCQIVCIQPVWQQRWKTTYETRCGEIKYIYFVCTTEVMRQGKRSD